MHNTRRWTTEGELYMLRVDRSQPIFDPRHAKNATITARNQQVLANMGLVVTIAKRYRKLGLTTNELIQEGTIGLMTGIERFDQALGYSLTTFVSFHIRSAMHRATATQGFGGRPYRLPVYMQKLLGRTARAMRKFRIAHGREATEEELIELLLKHDASDAQLRTHIRRAVSLLQVRDVALDHPKIGQDNGRPNGLAIADEASRRAEHIALALDIVEQSVECARNHSKKGWRYETIIRRQFGIFRPRESHPEIAADLGVSRARIQYLAHEALTRIEKLTGISAADLTWACNLLYPDGANDAE